MVARDPRRLRVGFAGHQRGQRRGVVAAAVAVVGQAARHQQRAEVGVAQAERTVGVAVLANRLARVARVVDDDLHRREHRPDRRLVGHRVELAVGLDELHQVDRRQVARRVVEEHVLRARIAGVDAIRLRAGVPLVDGGVELHARVAAHVRALGDQAHQLARLVGLHHRAVAHRLGVPGAVVEHRPHEVVGHAHAVVRVLEEHRRVGRAGERAVVAGVDQRPRLLLFLDLAVDELDDVRMLGVENDHLRRAARLAARLDDAGKRVVALHERHRARRRAAAREQFLRRTDRRQVRARARSELEQHPLGPRQGQDGIHRVLDRVDEAGRALRRLLEPAVEPDRAVERRLLVDQDVLEVLAERLQILVGREVPVRLRPHRDRVDDAADELLDAALALGGANLAAEIFRDDDIGRLLRPGLRNLDVALLEHHLTAFVADERRADFPLDLVERVDAGFREEARECQPGHGGRRPRFRARLLRLDKRRHGSRSTAFNRLLAGTCGLVGCALFHLVRSDHSGEQLPGSRRSPPAPEVTVVLVLEKSWPLSAPKPAANSREAGRSSLVRSVSPGGQICARLERLSSV